MTENNDDDNIADAIDRDVVKKTFYNLKINSTDLPEPLHFMKTLRTIQTVRDTMAYLLELNDEDLYGHLYYSGLIQKFVDEGMLLQLYIASKKSSHVPEDETPSAPVFSAVKNQYQSLKEVDKYQGGSSLGRDAKSAVEKVPNTEYKPYVETDSSSTIEEVKKRARVKAEKSFDEEINK